MWAVIRLENIFCSWSPLSKNVGHHDLDKQGKVLTPVSFVCKCGWGHCGGMGIERISFIMRERHGLRTIIICQ